MNYRHLVEMMGQRGGFVDHSSINCWAIRFLPLREKAFPKQAASPNCAGRYRTDVNDSQRSNDHCERKQNVIYRTILRAGSINTPSFKNRYYYSSDIRVFVVNATEPLSRRGWLRKSSLDGRNPVFVDFRPGDRALISREMIE